MSTENSDITNASTLAPAHVMETEVDASAEVLQLYAGKGADSEIENGAQCVEKLETIQEIAENELEQPMPRLLEENGTNDVDSVQVMDYFSIY